MSGWFDLAITLIAVHRFTLAGLKGYLSLFATLATYRGEHLARTSAGTTIAIAITPAALAACGTTLRLISVALRSKELLLTGGEAEVRPAIGALDFFVLISHG